MNDPEHRGCFLTNTCSELSATDADIAKKMNEHFDKMRLIIRDYLSNGSELNKKTRENISNTIITFFIGMTVEVKLQKDKKQIEQSINLLIQSLF